MGGRGCTSAGGDDSVTSCGAVGGRKSRAGGVRRGGGASAGPGKGP